MDIKDFYRLIMRELPIMIIATLLGLALSAGITQAITPIYQAKIQLFVSTPSSAFDVSALVQGSSFSQQRVKSYAQIVNGPETLNPVIKKLNLKYSYQELSKRVTATAPLDTVLISVVVSDESSILAARIANEIGRQFAVTVNQLEVTNSASTPTIKVSMVKDATPPNSPSSPKNVLNLLLGLILGFGLGLSISILRMIFDNSVKNEDDLDGTPVLGSINFDPSAASAPLITEISRYSPRTEGFRHLRTNLQYVRAENPPTVVAINSALPSEGKSTTAINLALSMSASGLSTILLEADMRRPKFHEYLKINKNTEGLSEILSGKVQGNLSKRIAQCAIQIPNTELTVIAAGATPPNPAELLDSTIFKELIQNLRKEFDYVVIDCPPTLLVADASIISAQTDGAIIVTRVAKTKIKEFLGARENLTNVDAPILGVFLNMIPHSRVDEYGRKYGYGYSYSYRKSRSYRNYRNDGYEPGYDPVNSYAPKDLASGSPELK